MRLFIFFALLSLIFFSCDENKRQNATPLEDVSSKVAPVVQTGIDTEPKLLSADSIQIIYYDDPDGDTLRYSRFFSYVNTSETAILEALLKTFRTPAAGVHQAKKCRSEGKMYLLHGEAPVKTVYFSTKAEECSYLYFIKDGLFYYFPLPEAIEAILKGQKVKAIRA